MKNRSFRWPCGCSRLMAVHLHFTNCSITTLVATHVQRTYFWCFVNLIRFPMFSSYFLTPFAPHPSSMQITREPKFQWNSLFIRLLSHGFLFRALEWTHKCQPLKIFQIATQFLCTSQNLTRVERNVWEKEKMRRTRMRIEKRIVLQPHFKILMVYCIWNEKTFHILRCMLNTVTPTCSPMKTIQNKANKWTEKNNE